MQPCKVLRKKAEFYTVSKTPFAQHAIDLIIPFRNEALNLGALLESLERLEHLQEDLCVLVDDASEDAGAEEIRENHFIKLIRLHTGESRGKKDALLAGIHSGNNAFILTSDADCIYQEGWLRAIRALLKPDTRMLIGPVLLVPGKGFQAWLQVQENMALLFLTRQTARKGLPFLCNGANLLVSRKAFQAANAYSEHAHRSSGDDVLLLRSLLREGNSGIAFADQPEACVFTHPVSTWSAWFNQRLRWAGKTGHFREPRRMVLSCWLLIQLFLPLILLPVYWPIAVLIPFVEYPFLLKTAAHFKRSFYIGDWFFFRLIYPLFVIALIPASLFLKTTWKGRPVG
jgi:poly-beta-1,6-N-acetyl-D-glucosamine synthase